MIRTHNWKRLRDPRLFRLLSFRRPSSTSRAIVSERDAIRTTGHQLPDGPEGGLKGSTTGLS
jgi:hypothetical protein